MTNPQGTAWETDIVARATAYGLSSDRQPKRAQKGEPDLTIGTPNILPWRVVPVVMWKRLVGKKDGTPRKPDGERRVVIIPLEYFLAMLMDLKEEPDNERYVLVQAKWTQNLNVTKTLGHLVDWMKAHGNRT